MSEFTKTLIVDGSLQNPQPPYYNNIQDAVDDLTGGGTIVVEEWNNGGNYYPITSAISVPDNVSIIGRGNAVLTVTADVSVFQATSKSRINISGFKIIVGKASYNSHLIDFTGVKNCIIEQLTISVGNGCSVSDDKAAIILKGDNTPEDLTCRGNVITECSITGFTVGYGINLARCCKRNIVDGNYIASCKTGIYLNYSASNIIMNNVASDATSHGIHLVTSNLNSIIGNHASANGDHGIFLEQTLGCAVQGNVCYSNGDDGIHLNGTEDTLYYRAELNAITGNSCYDNGVTGIYLEGYSKRNTVSGNVCANTTAVTHEIREYGSNVEKNLFVSNVCHNGALTTNGTSITANNKTN